MAWCICSFVASFFGIQAHLVTAGKLKDVDLPRRFALSACQGNLPCPLIVARRKLKYVINLFAPKSRIHKYFKITTWIKLKNKQHHSKVLLNSFLVLHLIRVLSIESRIEKLCITLAKVSLWKSKY